MPYVPGDFYRICDRTGKRVLASDTRQEWNGQFVRWQSFEERQPQDFVRGREDDQRVPDPRPRTTDLFIGTNAGGKAWGDAWGDSWGSAWGSVGTSSGLGPVTADDL